MPSDLAPAPHTKEDINKQKRGAENAAGTGVVATALRNTRRCALTPSNSSLFSSSIITADFWWNVVSSSTATCTDLLCLCRSSSVLFHGHRQVGIKTIA
ncbi:hypothetical protein HN51_061659 [Arachis hypogaea]